MPDVTILPRPAESDVGGQTSLIISKNNTQKSAFALPKPRLTNLVAKAHDSEYRTC